MERLCADIARLALGVLRARLRRDRYGLRILLICVVLFGAATFPNLLAELVMAAFPVCFLTLRPAVAPLASAALLG